MVAFKGTRAHILFAACLKKQPRGSLGDAGWCGRPLAQTYVRTAGRLVLDSEVQQRIETYIELICGLP